MKKLNILLFISLIFLFWISLDTGFLNLSILKILSGKATPEDLSVFLQIRLPRALLAVMVGMTLGLTGAAMQGLLRNPLADAGLIGVSGGAVLGAMLALYSGFSALGIWLLPAGGFAGALIAAALVLFYCGRNTSLLGLILAGAALNTLFFALSTLLLNFSKNPYAVLEIIYWQMGSLENRTLAQVAAAAPWMIVGWVLLLISGPALKLLTLGEETARVSGVSMTRTLWLVILGTAFSAGAAVSVCGSIGFVGLLIPHLMRPLVKQDPQKLLLSSALCGGVFMLAADIFCRLIPSGTELKIGVLTALLGAPFFLYLAFKTKTKIV